MAMRLMRKDKISIFRVLVEFQLTFVLHNMQEMSYQEKKNS